MSGHPEASFLAADGRSVRRPAAFLGPARVLLRPAGTAHAVVTDYPSVCDGGPVTMSESVRSTRRTRLPPLRPMPVCRSGIQGSTRFMRVAPSDRRRPDPVRSRCSRPEPPFSSARERHPRRSGSGRSRSVRRRPLGSAGPSTGGGRSARQRTWTRSSAAGLTMDEVRRATIGVARRSARQELRR